jgi:DNA repair exonuclease SbcCD ATPase subunit
MRLKRLHAEHFRRFADVDIEFAPGLNLIRGPNESGKSTIVRALLAAMFEKPGATTAKGRAHRRWGSSREPFVMLEFTDDDGEYRLIKDFGEGKVYLEQPGDAKRLGSARAVDSKIADALGFRDPALYLRTACVTHDQMVSLGEDSGAKKLAVMLREIVVGSNESAVMERAVKELSAEVDELKRGLERPTNNPGTIKRLQEEREVYMTRQKDLTLSSSDFDEQETRLAEVQRAIEQKSARVADLSELMEKNHRLSDAARKLNESSNRFDAADRAHEAGVKLEKLDAEIDARFDGFRDLDPGAAAELRRAIGVRESLDSLRADLAQEAEEPEPEPEPEPVKQGSRRLAIGCLAAGVVLLVLAIALGGAVNAGLFAIALPAALALAAGAYMLARARAATPPATEETEKTESLEEPLSRAEGEVAKLEDREVEFLESVGCKDADEFFDRFDDFEDLMAERKEAAAALKALLGGRSLKQLQAERRKAALDVSACEETIEEIEAYRVAPDKLEALARELKSLAREVDELATERDGLSFHLIKTASDPEEAAKIEEIVTWLWEAEQSARRRLRVYTLARDCMRQASGEMLASAVPVLAESVGRTFARLTGGRYQDVEVSESDLAISVYSPEKGDTIGADELLSTLSKGTASQLYLSARLELVDLLSRGRKPPLIFDDSFSYFDEGRLALLWDFLKEVASEEQVLVFTCTDRYDDLTDGVHVIDLG